MKLSVIFCFFLFCAQANGQSSFPMEYTRWYTAMNSCGELSATHYYTCGDTTVENEVFTPFLGRIVPFFGGLTFKHLGWFRKTGNQVYYRTDWFAPEYLLYQFDLEVGDTCRVVRNYTSIGGSAINLVYPLFEVAYTDTVLIKNVWRKRWVLTSDDPEIGNEIWLEGIGSTRGPVDVTYCFEGQETTLICMSQGFNVLYKSNDEWICAILSNPDCNISTGTSQRPSENMAVFPNPFSAFLDVLIPELPDIHVRMINAMGQPFSLSYQQTSEGIRITRGELSSGYYRMELLSGGQVIFRSSVIAL
ncbi:MAG TPA: hypothetical protein DCF33_13730 [Saprospirales bacterium]|nr:hypothetical protein [Saprospirales bacterium]